MASGATLSLDADTLTNKIGGTDGTVQVDAGGELDLDASAIDQGVVTVDGQLTAASGTSTISNVGAGTGSGSFDNDGTIEVAGSATLVLDHDLLTNKIGGTDGTVQVDAGGELDLNASTIDQGVVTVDGTLTAASGSSTLSNGGRARAAATSPTTARSRWRAARRCRSNADTLTNKGIGGTDGAVQVAAGGELDLNASTIDQGVVTVDGPLTAASGTSTISNTGAGTGSGSFDNDGTIEVAGSATLVLDHDLLTKDRRASGDGTVQVDTGGELDLNASTIDQGVVTVDGTLTAASGSNTLSNLASGSFTSDGTIAVASGATLSLDSDTLILLSDTNNSGEVRIHGGATLDLNGTTITAGALTVNTPQFQAADSVDTNVFLSALTLLDMIAGDSRTFTLTVTAVGGSVAQGRHAGSVGDAMFEASGSLSDLDTQLADGFTFVPNDDGTNTLIFSVTDEQGNTAFKSLSITTASGSAPVVKVTDASGAIHNGGLVDVTGNSVLTSDVLFNAGVVKIETGQQLTLNQSGIAGGTVTDLGTIEVANGRFSNTTANLAHDATLTVDDGTTLVLAGATIDGGTINDGTSGSGGNIAVRGSSTIRNAALNNGQVTVGNDTLTLDDDTVTGTTFTAMATGSTIAVDSTAMLTLSGVTINDAVFANAGTVEIAADSAFNGVDLSNHQLAVDGGTTLTLDGTTITGGTVDDYSTDGSGHIVAGHIEVAGNSTVSNTSINNGQVTVDSGQRLQLEDTTITGSTLSGPGTVETAAANTQSTLDGVTLASGTTVTVDHGTLDLTGTIGAAGATIDVATGANVALDLDDVTVQGGALGGAGSSRPRPLIRKARWTG